MMTWGQLGVIYSHCALVPSIYSAYMCLLFLMFYFFTYGNEIIANCYKLADVQTMVEGLQGEYIWQHTTSKD